MVHFLSVWTWILRLASLFLTLGFVEEVTKQACNQGSFCPFEIFKTLVAILAFAETFNK